MSSDNGTRSDIMTMDDFVEWFVTQVEWCPPQIAEDDVLVDDLGMDSVGAVDLLVALEDAVGGDVVMPIEMLLHINTVRDAYLQYCTLAQLPYADEGPR